MKLKKKKDKSVGVSVLLRKGNKILMEANVEKKCGAETEGKAIQRLPQLGSIPYTVIKPDTIIDAKECMLTGLDIAVF
jgi:hypothetical protein